MRSLNPRGLPLRPLIPPERADAMRIISGSARGVRLEAPHDLSTRPTGDRVKEGLFSALMPFVPGARVLDMFAGSGQLALEALSRGAAFAVTSDHDARACKVISQNAARCRLDGSDSLKVLRSAFDRVHLYLPADTRFDLVFIDPPYRTDLAAAALLYLQAQNLLSEGALVAVECGAGPLPDPKGYALHREYRYGGTAVRLYRPSPDSL